MRSFGKTVLILLVCLALILVSTCINVKAGLEKKYDRVCDALISAVIDFADNNGLSELESKARSAEIDGDYSGLIEMYNSMSVSGFASRDSVDKAVRGYNDFLRMLQRFPAKQLSSLVNFSF